MRKHLTVLLSTLTLLIAPAMISPAHADSNGAQGPKEWTFLVYLNGNNNLDSFGAQNINQMEKVGSTANLNIVVQWASEEAGTTKRLLVKKDSNTNTVTSPIVQNAGKVDMGDWHSLVDFIKWGAAKYPAKHYFVDVWDHGSGWHDLALGGSLGIRPLDISWDDNTGHSITTEQLGQALAEASQALGQKIDVYGSDACLMAMAEVATEVSDSVQVYAGSEETEPGAGWPYDTFLARWAAKPLSTPQDVAKMLVEEYTKSYQGGENGNEEVTFSAFDLSQLPALQQSVAALGEKLSTLSSGARAQIVSAIGSSQSFTDSDYVDLMDFVTNVQHANVSSMDSSVLNQVKQAAGAFVLESAVTSQYARAKGVSIWLPNTIDGYNQYSSRYQGMKFDEATHWGDALRYVLQDAHYTE